MRRFVVGLAGALLMVAGVARAEDDDEWMQTWREQRLELPSYPEEARLIPFDVATTSRNAFFIDESSLKVGEDGVVRAAIVVRTPEGAVSVTYEGIRCETVERKLFATGQAGQWVAARNSAWQKIRGAGSNAYPAALFRNHFCPDGVIVSRVADALVSFRTGGRRSLFGQ